MVLIHVVCRVVLARVARGLYYCKVMRGLHSGAESFFFFLRGVAYVQVWCAIRSFSDYTCYLYRCRVVLV